MNWSDEHYVKFYTRRTATSLSWPWQTTALWPNILSRVDGAGIIEFGRLTPERAVSVVTGIPLEVVAAGLPALIEDGTIELRERALIIPNFIEAQEARKSESLKKADQRERHKAKVRLQVLELREGHVPQCPAVSPDVPLQPSPAQPSSLKTAGDKRPPPIRVRKPDAPDPLDPRFGPLKLALIADYERVRGEKYNYGGAADTEAVKRLVMLAPDDVVRARWVKALKLGTVWPGTSSIAGLASSKKWNDLAAPTVASKGPIDAGTQSHTHTGWVENF